MATQEKTWNVANRLHSLKDSDSPAVNHIITGADEIYDDEKGAKQSTINTQTDAALADRYTKSETYSKEQLDALITTPDVNYVTVVATNATTAVTDILPATGEANTIYRVGNWNGTQYEPTMYALYAWNGSAYVCLAVRSFVGEVYDVSVNHPDGQGNPTPYADLAAALGTDGANIPADIRRGGMTIQFIEGTVQSNDNKYVQYRLMAATWSNVVTDWQGIDDELTPGSDNLAKSGVVYSAINDINLFSHPLANRVIKELYIPNVDYTAFTKITFWFCIFSKERYWNVIRLYISDDDEVIYYLHNESFNTEEEALADMANMNGLCEHEGRYSILSVSQDLAGTNIGKVDFTINRDIANLNNSPVIKESLDKALLEASIVGKEASANKVSAWSQIPTDNHYPSEKLVHDTILTPLNSISKTIESGSKNLYDYEHVGVLSGIIAAKGYVRQDYNGFYTGKIPVEPNHYYYLSNRSESRSNGVARAVRCLDANDNPMKVLAPSNGEEYENYYFPNADATDSAPNGQFKTPANAAYIQINLTPINVTELGNYYQIMLEDVGDEYNPDFVPSEYEPYNYTTIIKDESLQYPVKPLADKVEELVDNSNVTVKLLCVGSSFTQDEFGYLPFILNSIAPNVKLTIGIAYIGGSPLPQHYAYLTHADSEHKIVSDEVEYWVVDGASKPYKKFDRAESVLTEYAGYILYKSVNTEPWSSGESMLIEDVLTNEDWDIVTYQGAAAQAFKSWDDYYAPYIFEIVKQVNAKVGNNVKLAFNLIHSGYASSDEVFLSRWLETAKNAKKVLQQTGISLLFPSGTAIQNLRCIDALRAMGDGDHHNLLADTAHLQDGIGPLCTAYANALTLLKAVGIDYEGVIGEGTRPDAAWVTDNNIPGRNIGSGVIGITNDYCLLAQIAATNAVKYPYSVINPSVSAPYTDRDTDNKLGISKNELSTDVQAFLNKAESAYQKPSSGIPSTDLASDVIPDVSNFITASVNNLTNYYLKNETYTKDEVAALIGAIQQFHYEIYASTSEVTAPASNVLYLIGPASISGVDKYEEYVYANNEFVKIGDTTIDLSGYATITALNSALTTLHSALENGDIIPAMTDNLASWAEDVSEVSNSWDETIRSTAGDDPIDTAFGGVLTDIVAKSDFKCDALKTSGYNLLRLASNGGVAVTVGNGWYFPVPHLELGVFGDATKNNGVLLTDKDSNNIKTATVRFKALADGVPTSVNDGVEATYQNVTYNDKTFRTYLTSGAGYLIVSGITYADTCAHLAWEDWYDKYVSPTAEDDAGDSIDLTVLFTAAPNGTGKFLVLGSGGNTVATRATRTGNTQMTITDPVGRVTSPSWTNELQEDEETYKHSLTISDMKADGLAQIEGSDQVLTVVGTTVSYTDANATAISGAVRYEKATAATANVTLTKTQYALNDCGIEMKSGATGEAYFGCTYSQNVADALSQIAKVKLDISLSVVAEAMLYLYNENKALRELLSGKDNAVLPYIKAQTIECVDKMTMGVPDVLVSGVEGAPSAANVPDNWDEETMTVWNGCPRKIGQQYVDKVSKKVYYAVAVTGSTSDWVALN